MPAGVLVPEPIPIFCPTIKILDTSRLLLNEASLATNNLLLNETSLATNNLLLNEASLPTYKLLLTEISLPTLKLLEIVASVIFILEDSVISFVIELYWRILEPSRFLIGSTKKALDTVGVVVVPVAFKNMDFSALNLASVPITIE